MWSAAWHRDCDMNMKSTPGAGCSFVVSCHPGPPHATPDATLRHVVASADDVLHAELWRLPACDAADVRIALRLRPVAVTLGPQWLGRLKGLLGRPASLPASASLQDAVWRRVVASSPPGPALPLCVRLMMPPSPSAGWWNDCSCGLFLPLLSGTSPSLLMHYVYASLMHTHSPGGNNTTQPRFFFFAFFYIFCCFFPFFLYLSPFSRVLVALPPPPIHRHRPSPTVFIQNAEPPNARPMDGLGTPHRRLWRAQPPNRDGGPAHRSEQQHRAGGGGGGDRPHPVPRVHHRGPR